jgi:hypothetical protein
MPNFLIDEDTGLLAAEFVLGTLDSEERASAQALLQSDHNFIAMVRIWERRFGELHLMVEPVEPAAPVLDRVRTRLGIPAPSEPAASTPPDSAPLQAPNQDAPESLVPPVVAEEEPTSPMEVSADAALLPPQPPDAIAETPSPEAAPAPALDAAETAPATGPANEARVLEPTAKSEPTPPAPITAADRRGDIARSLARSRGRWRAFGTLMTLVVLAIGTLLAAWRFVPDRVPSGLRPSELMMWLGIEAVHSRPPPTAAAPAQGPPEPQFDE